MPRHSPHSPRYSADSTRCLPDALEYLLEPPKHVQKYPGYSASSRTCRNSDDSCYQNDCGNAYSDGCHYSEQGEALDNSRTPDNGEQAVTSGNATFSVNSTEKDTPLSAVDFVDGYSADESDQEEEGGEREDSAVSNSTSDADHQDTDSGSDRYKRTWDLLVNQSTHTASDEDVAEHRNGMDSGTDDDTEGYSPAIGGNDTNTDDLSGGVQCRSSSGYQKSNTDSVHQGQKRKRSVASDCERQVSKRHHGSGPSPGQGSSSSRSRASPMVKLSGYHPSEKSTIQVNSPSEVAHLGMHHSRDNYVACHRNLLTETTVLEQHRTVINTSCTAQATPAPEPEAGVLSARSQRCRRRAFLRQQALASEDATTTASSKNQERQPIRQPRTYAELLEYMVDDSTNDNSDDSYEPSEEPPDATMSETSEDEHVYRVRVPKTAAQLLAEYQSDDSEGSNWEPH